MVHTFQMNNKYLVFDVNSNSLMSVDNMTYNIINAVKELLIDVDNINYDNITHLITIIINKLDTEYPKDELTECANEILELINKKRLFSPEISYAYIDEKSKNRFLKALCLNIAHDCNLKCKYCFAHSGAYSQPRSLMSVEIAKKAIDFLIKASGPRKNLEIDFFGGEPLLNFEVVKQTIEYARSFEKQYNKKFRFTITTNGLLLDKQKIDYINENMYNMVISLDGRKSVNDEMRKTKNGTGSYDLVIEKALAAVKDRNHLEYWIRGTFTNKNLDFGNDIKHLVEAGFNRISIEPVVSDMEYRIKTEDLDQIKQEYENIANFYLENYNTQNKFEFFHFNMDLNKGPCIVKRTWGCGSGVEYMAIAPNGDIYPCHQFVGASEYLIDNINNTHKNKTTNNFCNCNVFTKEKCRKCWAKYYCSGGCHANNLSETGNIDGTYDIGCEIHKKRTECALYVKSIIR